MKLLFHSKPSEVSLKLQSLAEFLGATVEHIDVAMIGSLQLAAKEAIAVTGGPIVLDVASLEPKSDAKELRALAAFFGNYNVTMLLLVSHTSDASAQIVSLLTNNAIRGLAEGWEVEEVSFSTALSGELSCQSYQRKRGKAANLIPSSTNELQVIMTLGGSPTFVCVTNGKMRIFVWVTDGVFDILRPLAAEIEFEQAVDRYIPAIIFLRSVLGAQCWHNPSPGAGIVIDDPLLKEKYGFIHFPQLLESARRHKYYIALAFIPWNHWRTREKEAQLFRNYSDCFSIYAHGCDHTHHEFGATDYDDLLSKNLVALERMERHGYRTGLRSEPLMVCPQEQYSLEAMRAFSDSHQFMGLICTACMPRDLASPQIRGADLLLPAQDSFFGFPVFKRHYSGSMATFAMALFLGKPAILVEHHEFFRDGPGAAEKFVADIARIRPDLKWRRLLETVTRTHARRRLSRHSWEVRFFTDTFQLEHDREEPTDYRCIRRIPEATLVQRVMVDGSDVPFVREDSFLSFEAPAHRPRTMTIKVVVSPIKPIKTHSAGVRYHASVALRRGLSEFRDNVIARNHFALKAANCVMRCIKEKAR